MEKSRRDLDASVRSLEKLLTDFEGDFKHGYRYMAAELRKLLCDTQRGKDNSLLPRIFPDVRLHQIMGQEPLFDKAIMLTQYEASFRDGKYRARLHILKKEQLLPLGDWLNQRLFVGTERTSVKELIRQVADKEGVHSDPEYSPALKAGMAIQIIDDDFHATLIYVLADYIYCLLVSLMSGKEFEFKSIIG